MKKRRASLSRKSREVYNTRKGGFLTRARRSFSYNLRSTAPPEEVNDYLKGGLLARAQKAIGYNLRSLAPPREINLYLKPEMERVPGEPFIPKYYHSYRLRRMNYLMATINGISTAMYVDSGTSKIFLSMEDARKIGINLSHLKWKKVIIQTLENNEHCREALIKDKTIQLLDGKTIVTDLNILDDNSHGITFFGACLLKKYQFLQKFWKSGRCQLYLKPEGEMIKKSGRRRIVHEFSLNAYFHEDFWRKHLKVKIDTGTPYTILSKRFMKKLEKFHCYQEYTGCPSKLRLLTLTDFVIETSKIKIMQNPGDDLCIGRDFFIKYEVFIDYGENWIYFNVNGRTYKAKMLDAYARFKQLKVSA